MATVVSRLPAARSDRNFFTGMALFFIVISAAGFWQSFYLASWFGTKPLSPIMHLHGVVMTAWVLFFLLQTAFVRNARVEAHRRWGMVGLLLAGAVGATSLATVMATLGAGRLDKSVPVEIFLVFPIGLSLMFWLLVGCAVYWVRDAATHKRLMVLATLATMATPIARLRLPFLPPAALGGNIAVIALILPLVLHDLSSFRRVHPATVWGGGFIAAMLPLRLLVAHTDAWKAFVGWLGAT
ncbi:hypothetical protein [Novosphingobium sp. AP12]|uniref:hypothetical protein n=1 Tax=Novosphingobium sp. AP12 TaxID=1144305 RepID=UPI00027205FA|nr:hypothetical protein [Novosphingobium sp. AP12]EJL22654.1 hypothetical protein PMI02_04483 [Novosphingobium sp. AP12]